MPEQSSGFRAMCSVTVPAGWRGRQAGPRLAGGGRVAEVAGHSSVAEPGERVRAAADARSARHVRAIRLLAKGREVAEVAPTTAFGVRWAGKLPARYDVGGPDAPGGLRRRNGTGPTIPKPALLDGPRLRPAGPPADGGPWTSRKVAAWMAGELGLASAAVQRGREAPRALGRSVQVPRPGHPARAAAEEREAFEKARHRPRRRGGAASGRDRRSLRHGRAPRRAGADPPPRPGAERRATARRHPDRGGGLATGERAEQGSRLRACARSPARHRVQRRLPGPPDGAL